MDVEKYLRICEQLGQEPDPTKMPLDSSGFQEENQVAFFMFSLMFRLNTIMGIWFSLLNVSAVVSITFKFFDI